MKIMGKLLINSRWITYLFLQKRIVSFSRCQYFNLIKINDYVMKLKDVSCDTKTHYVLSREKYSGRNCGYSCQFYIVFFEDCEIFFGHSALCALALLFGLAGCIDWFRNHPPVKQIYRIIVKKKKHERQDRFVETTNNALQTFGSDRAQFCNHG